MKLTRGKNHSKLLTDYNYDHYRTFKLVSGSKVEDGIWLFPNRSVSLLEEYLKDITAAVDECNELLEKQVIKTVKVEVVKENKKTINIRFTYDENLEKYIKMLYQKKYNETKQTWNIYKYDANWLYEKLKVLKYIDLSDLKPYTKNNSTLKISLDNFDMERVPEEYQIWAANQMLKYKKIINALEAGLGKTHSTILVTETLKKKTLIVCPVSAKGVWRDEIKIVNKNANINVISAGDPYKTADYIIINYDILGNYYEELMNDGFEVLICDEAHKIKGITNKGEPSSERAKLIVGTKEIKGLAEGKEYVFPITATPFINYTKDIFNLLHVIEHPLSKSWYSFAYSFCGVKDNGFGKNFNGSSNQDILYERLYPEGLIRLKAEDYARLPERTRRFVPADVDLTEYNQEVEDYLKNTMAIKQQGAEIVRFTAMRMKLAEAKTKFAYNMINDLLEQNKSVVVMTNYEKVVRLMKNKYGEKAVTVIGSNTDKQRDEAVRKFQAKEVPILIGNIDAAGESLTLTAAHHMVVVDMHWSPIVMVDQMEKRLHRKTQTQPVNIHYLFAEKALMDQLLVKMMNEKLSGASKALDGKSEQFFFEELVKEFDRTLLAG